MMDSAALCKVLHYRSAKSLRKAHEDGRLSLALFHLPGRRGVFAWTVDVVHWMVGSASLCQESTADPAVKPSSGRGSPSAQPC